MQKIQVNSNNQKVYFNNDKNYGECSGDEMTFLVEMLVVKDVLLLSENYFIHGHNNFFF